MPMIPVDRSQISMNVTGSEVGSYGNGGATGGAIAQVGQRVVQTALELDSQMRRIEAQDAATTAHLENVTAAQEFQMQQELTSPDGYVYDENGKRKKNKKGLDLTISEEYAQWANERHQKIQESMPSELARMAYLDKSEGFFVSSINQAKSKELSIRVDASAKQDEQNLQSMASTLVDAPSIDGLYFGADELANGILSKVGKHNPATGEVDGLYNLPTAKEKVRRNNQQLAESTVRGAITSITNGVKSPSGLTEYSPQIDYWLKVLDGEDTRSKARKRAGGQTLSDMLDPDRKDELRNKLLGFKETTKKMDLSTLMAQTQAWYSQRDLNLDAPIAPLVQGWQQALKDGQRSTYEYAEIVGDMIAYDHSRGTFSDPSFLLASPAAKKARIESLHNGIYEKYKNIIPVTSKDFPQVGAHMREKIVNSLNALAEKTDNLANSDFVAFAQFDSSIRNQTGELNFGNLQGLKGKAATLQSRSQKLSVLGDSYFGGRSGSFRLISRNESKSAASFLKSDMVSDGDKVDGLLSLYAADPKNYSRHVNQMVKDKNLSAEWRLIAVNQERMVLADTVKTILRGADIRKDAAAVLESTGKSESDFKAAVLKKSNDYLIAFNQRNSDSPINEQDRELMRNVVVTKAMDLFRRDGGAQGVDHYATEAVKSIFGSRYHVISAGGGGMFSFEPGRRNRVLLPTRHPETGAEITSEDARVFHVNRNVYLSPSKIKEMGGVPVQGTSDIDPKKFYEFVSDNAELVPADDYSGYYISYKNKNQDVRVMTGKKDRNGRPIPLLIPTNQLLTPLPRPDKPYKNDGKSFLDKVKDAFGNSTAGSY